MIVKKPVKETQTTIKNKTIKPENTRVTDGVEITVPSVVKPMPIDEDFWIVETENNGEVERHKFKTKKAATSYIGGLKNVNTKAN